MSNIGEVRPCAHCKGSGLCVVNSGHPCANCANAAGQHQGLSAGLSCATCGGKGSVWVGPNIVYLPPPEK